MARILSGTEDQMCLTADVHEDLIASGYEDGVVRFWDTRCKNDSSTLDGRCGNSTGTYDDISSIIFANQQKQEIYMSAGKCIYRIDMRKAENESWNKPLFEFNEDDINQITISERDEMLAAADDNNVITVIDMKNSRLLTSLKKHKNAVYTVQFRPGKSRELISGGYDCSLIHWDVLKSRAMGSFNLSDIADPNWDLPKAFNPSYVLSCDFGSLNGPANKPNIVMAGTDNGNLHCFNCNKNLLHYRTFKAHDLGVTKVHFAPSNPQSEISKTCQFYSGSNDGKIKMWNFQKLFTDPNTSETPEPLHVFNHGSKINYLTSLRSTYLVICDTSGGITLLPMIPKECVTE